jgi:hypothetical protein
MKHFKELLVRLVNWLVPEGYENAHGFHLGREPDPDPQAAFDPAGPHQRRERLFRPATGFPGGARVPRPARARRASSRALARRMISH